MRSEKQTMSEGKQKVYKPGPCYFIVMAGAQKEIKRNRQRRIDGSLNNRAAGALFLRIKYLVDHINVSLGMASINTATYSIGRHLEINEELALRQEISEFIGLVCYMQGRYKNRLVPYQTDIDRLKIRIGQYFI